jgi:type IV pilus assembly protein PilO
MKKISIPFEKLEPIIERIEKLSTIQRVAIYAATFIILVGSVVWFLYMPKYEKKEQLTKETETLEGKLRVAKRNAAQLPKLRKQMKAAELEYRLVMKALPERKEIPTLLTSISQSGREAGLEFLLFQPSGEAPRDFYAEIPVSINVTGSYHNVAEFFDRVASLSRIVNIKNIQMSPSKGGKLNTSCTAVTYKFMEPKKKDAKGKKRRKRK